MKNKNDIKGAIIATFVVALIMTVMMITYTMHKQPSIKGSKNVIVRVIVPEEDKKYEYEVYTDAEYLGDALRETNFIKGENSQYGFFVTEVKGIAADSSKNQYWMLTKKGEYVNTGVDQTPVYDGDEFEFTLATY